MSVSSDGSGSDLEGLAKDASTVQDSKTSAAAASDLEALLNDCSRSPM